MSAIEKLKAAQPPPRRPAPHVVTLEPHHWADTCPRRPATQTKIGLRLPSEKAIQDARALAAKDIARDFAEANGRGDADEVVHDAMLEAYNAQIMINILAHALCDAEDATRQYFERLYYDMVAASFRPDTIKMLWDELGLLRAALNPSQRLATDEECAAVGVEPARAHHRFRRLLALMHAEIETMTTSA